MLVLEKRSWIHLILLWKGSALRRTWKRVALTTALAGGVVVAHEWYGLAIPDLTLVPFSLVGLALGVFLGFRNNSAYDRFWEGRKLWGRLVNVSRSFTRQVLTLISDPDAGSAGESATSDVQRELVYRHIAFVHAFRMHLRDDWDFEELAPFLSKNEIGALESESNRPNAILQGTGDRIAALWRRDRIDRMHIPVFEEAMTEMSTVQGACERIKATPIPYSYTIVIHRLVLLYCLALPFGLYAQVGVVSPLVVMIVAYAFYGLDAVGDEIEAPFDLDPNDLPLSTLSRMIEVNLRQRLGETEVPPLLRPRDGVLD